MINKYLNKKAGMCYSQIFLLIFGMIGFCYIIGEVYGGLEERDEGEGGFRSEYSFKLFGRISSFKELFFGDMIEGVDAVVDVCCEELLIGETCQMAPADQCNQDFQWSPNVCENTGFCEIGCCISPTNGLCNKNTGKRDCERMEGDFDSDRKCNIDECEKGCCILGDETKFTTYANCVYEGNTQGDIPTEFRADITSGAECLLLADSGVNGACVYEVEEERRCVKTTLEDCIQRTGSDVNFYKDWPCSHADLNTTCSAQNYTGCVAGKEDVYWFDSCGNEEEVAEDCNFYTGTYCKEGDNSASCEDIACEIDGERREHGESWCEYDGAVGDGRDTVGSRHVKHICYMGVERLMPCADYRNEICVEEQAQGVTGSFAQAACRPNQWRTCLDYNRQSDGSLIEQKCDQNVDCFMQHIDMSGAFDFKVCLPAYPPGFDIMKEFNLYNEDGSFNEAAYYGTNMGDGICSIATMTCETTWQCCLIFFVPVCWCVDSCDCHTPKFPTDMNRFCTSLGDCGVYTNWIGDATNYAHTVTGDKDVPPRLSQADADAFSKYADKELYADQDPASPGSYEFISETSGIDIGGLAEAASDADMDLTNRNLSSFEIELLEAAGSYGSPLLLQMITKDNVSGRGLIPSPTNLATFMGASYSQQGILAQIMPADVSAPPDLSMLMALLFGIIGYLMGGIMGAMLGALLGLLIFGACWVEYHHVDFRCMPWEPPPGGEKCNECNMDLNVPCTEYRCESLGQLCYLANKGSNNELCLSRPVNESLPVISPFEAAITEGYSYVDVSTDGFRVANASDPSGCIEPYTPIDIGIKVDPMAKCRFGDAPELAYEEMPDIFGPKGNYILPVHLTKLFFVSPEAFDIIFDISDDVFLDLSQQNLDSIPTQFLDDIRKAGIDINNLEGQAPHNIQQFMDIFGLSDDDIAELGKVDYYIKCRTASGKVNPVAYRIQSCVKPGPDLTAPRISDLSYAHGVTGGYVAFGINKTKYTLYVNEPSFCRWSWNDVTYDEMENDLNCGSNIIDALLGHFDDDNKLFFCDTTLTGLDSHNEFFFKCMDMATNNNTMSQSYIFNVEDSDSPLYIDRMSPAPGEKIITGVEPTTVRLILETSGGALSGKSECEWDGGPIGGDRFIYDDVNGSDYHEYEVTLIRGMKNINYTCEDIAKNSAENSTSFEIEIDDNGPIILRVYYEGGLKVITNEEGECRYSFSRNFNFENATVMSGSGLDHYAGWSSNTYYIQCEDDYGNKGRRMSVLPVA